MEIIFLQRSMAAEAEATRDARAKVSNIIFDGNDCNLGKYGTGKAIMKMLAMMVIVNFERG